MEKKDSLLEEFKNFKIDVKKVKGGSSVHQYITAWTCTGDDSTGVSDPVYDSNDSIPLPPMPEC